MLSACHRTEAICQRRLLMVVRLFLTASVILLPSVTSAQSRAGSEMFDPAEVVEGITISREACAKFATQDTAIWVEMDGEGACLRYYAAGLQTVLGRTGLPPHGSTAMCSA